MNGRNESLDALEVIAILGMVLSGSIVYSEYDAWLDVSRTGASTIV